MTKAALAAAVAAAVTETLEGSPAPAKTAEDTGVKPEVPVVKVEAKPDSPVVGNEVKTDAPTVDAEQLAAFQARFGVDLSVLPDDETRAKFMAEATETNKTIGKLQRENAELKKVAVTPPPAPTPVPVAELTVDVSKLSDEQIAQALGIDLENSADPERDNREVALARKLLEQEERLERVEQSATSSATERVWTKALDELEGRFGTLPEDITRVELLAWAAEQGIASPEAAYWAAVGPIRATVAKALESKLIELKTDAKKLATTPRPTTSAGVVEAALESKNVKDGIKEAFEKARAKLGITLSSD